MTILEGEPQFTSFMEDLIIFDGSYIKYWDGTNDIDILYDDGTGSSSYQWTNRTGEEDDYLALGNGTNTRVAAKFTTQSWDSGYTIPPTSVFAKLQKNGTGGSGSITMKIRLAVSPYTELASATFVEDVTEVAETVVEYDAQFTESDITTEMSPETAYLVSLEYSGGAAANYIKVITTTVASGGVGYHYVGGPDYVADATHDPVMAVRPGRPPKAVWGIVHKNRLFAIESEDGDNPSRISYCAAGNHYDWSTDDGGGYLTAIDASDDNFPVGALASYRDVLYIFGTKKQPFLAKLSGTSPADENDPWQISTELSRISAHYKTVQVLADGIMFLHPTGIDMITTTEEYGDIAADSQGDNIKRTIHQYYSTNAVSGYCPEFGLYVLKLEDYDNSLVAHTRLRSVRYKGLRQKQIFPFTEWLYAFSGTPTAFGTGDGYLIVGTDDGKLFKMDNSLTQDDGNEATYTLKTNYQTTEFGDLRANKVNFSAYGKFGGQFDVSYFRNYNRVAHDTETITLPWDTLADVEDLTMPVEDMLFLVDPEYYLDRVPVNFNYRTLMIGIDNLQTNGYPLYFGRIIVLADSVGGF